MNPQAGLGRGPPGPAGLVPGGMRPQQPRPQTKPTQPAESREILSKRRLDELVAQIDPRARLADDVTELLFEVADDFIESVTTFACKIAKHRKSNTLEAKDIQLHLSRNWNIHVPGFGEEVRPTKRRHVAEIHKDRVAAVRKSQAQLAQQGSSSTASSSSRPPASRPSSANPANSSSSASSSAAPNVTSTNTANGPSDVTSH